MFKAEGKFPVVITDVIFAEPKFAKDVDGAFDVCVQVRHRDDPSQEDYWYGEYSTRYGVGTVSDKTQIELTMRTLHEIGMQGNDLSTAKQQLVGRETFATTKAQTTTAGKTFYNVKYLGESGGGGPKPITQSEMLQRASQLLRNVPAPAPAAAPMSAPAGAPANPFDTAVQPAAGAPAVAGASANPFDNCPF